MQAVNCETQKTRGGASASSECADVDKNARDRGIFYRELSRAKEWPVDRNRRCADLDTSINTKRGGEEIRTEKFLFGSVLARRFLYRSGYTIAG